ncbi:hypothetical protein TWF751_010936 [Orbilia oligospora]|nr:hypothetical protein TWF751_010936 [Orbilia oligospora]
MDCHDQLVDKINEACNALRIVASNSVTEVQKLVLPQKLRAGSATSTTLFSATHPHVGISFLPWNTQPRHGRGLVAFISLLTQQTPRNRR